MGGVRLPRPKVSGLLYVVECVRYVLYGGGTRDRGWVYVICRAVGPLCGGLGVGCVGWGHLVCGWYGAFPFPRSLGIREVGSAVRTEY